MANIQWITHAGKRVLLLDFSQRRAQRVEELAREVQQVITAQKPASVLVLADFTATKFSKEAVKLIARTAATNRPYVRRTAWVGTESLPAGGFEAIQATSQRDIHRFATREEALQFLTAE